MKTIAEEVKHTHGPWILNGALGKIENAAGVCIATLAYESQNETGTTYGAGQNLPNAKLIAAAPELLHALQVAVEHMKNIQAKYKPEHPFAIGMYEQAIRKATSRITTTNRR